MKTILIAILAVLCVALAGFLGYQKLTQPETTPIVVNQLTTSQPSASCVKEGEEISPATKDIKCCGQGVILKQFSYLGDEGKCVDAYSPTVGPTGICIACGNGVCGKGENQCNCPEDCKTDETASWQTYTNQQWGFTIKYPTDWVLISNSAILEIKKTDTTQPKTQLTPGDVPLEYPYYGIKVSAFIEETNAKKLEDLRGTCVNDTANILDRKIVAGEVAIKCTSGSAPGGYFDVIFMHNGVVYELEYTYASPDETKYKFASISDQMLSTFKFIK